MKLVSLIIALICITNILEAQIEKGRISIGGNLSGNTYKYKDEFDTISDSYNTKNRYFQISPTFNYFVKDGLSINTYISFANSHYENSNKRDYTSSISTYSYNNYTTTFRLGIGLTKYYPITEKFYFTLNPGIEYIHSNDFSESSDISQDKVIDSLKNGRKDVTESIGNGFNIYLRPGFSFAITDRAMLTGGIGRLEYNSLKSNLQTTKTNIDNSSETSSELSFKNSNSNFNFQVQSSLYIGFFYYLNRSTPKTQTTTNNPSPPPSSSKTIKQQTSTIPQTPTRRRTSSKGK